MQWLDGFSLQMSWVIKGVFELNLLLLFVICLIHSLRTHSWQRTCREFGAGFMMTALCESAGVLSGAYIYPGFQFYILATPVGNPASWVALIYIIMMISDRIVFGASSLRSQQETSTNSWLSLTLAKGPLYTAFILACCDAWIALSLDLVLDPIATIYNWWLWVPHEEGVRSIEVGEVVAYNFDHHVWMNTPQSAIGSWFMSFFEGGWRYPTRLMGIPLINFIAWLVFVFTFTLQFRWVESKNHWGEWRKTWILWSLLFCEVPILCMLLIIPNL